ncbi:hypothetical protein [Nannocystis punicea]|uniref:Myxococcus cysteine-rich repeat-containing protein n=1 Tax=Nannocystis punicea TaxID=2995304 RepID=A0ABY7GS91_9BACT|nr:hypothetical protein [Nannocystis poenicansa]WAS89808.1 hypothetical protein O0S08_26755 [Nannocystis poenicansa]
MGLLLILAVACGDNGGVATQSATDSDSGTAGTMITTDGNTTQSTGEVPTTSGEGSDSASDSQTGEASETAGESATDGTTDNVVTDTAATETTNTATESCVDECAQGEQQCDGADGVQVCGAGEAGCLVWGEAEACPGGQTCQDGACAAGCEDACEAGGAQCLGDGVANCVEDPRSGCTVWSDPEPCDDGESCVDGVCAGPTVDCIDDCEWTDQGVAANIDLYGVWGSSATAVWTVGKAGSALYYNGNTWKAVDTGILTRLDCVQGSGPDDVYAISSDGKLIRWDGAEWTLISNLGVDDPGTSSCLSVLGPEDLLAIVLDDDYDVALWRVQKGVKTEIGGWNADVLPPLGVKEVSVAVTAFSPTSLLSSTGHVWRWDGVKAVDLQVPQHAYGLWATAVDFAYVAGRNIGLGARWDGQAWKSVNPALDGYLHMFTGSSAQRIFAVGEQKADGSGAIVAFDGIGWSPAAVPAEAQALFAAWTAPTGEVFAVGKGGTIVIGE